MKEWTLVGITPVVVAVTALGGAERGVQVSDEENMTFPERRLVYICLSLVTWGFQCRFPLCLKALLTQRAAMPTDFYKGKILTSTMLSQREALGFSSNSIATILRPFSLPGDLMAQT